MIGSKNVSKEVKILRKKTFSEYASEIALAVKERDVLIKLHGKDAHIVKEAINDLGNLRYEFMKAMGIPRGI